MSTRYIAFLRAINVGGHTIKMDALRGLFEALGYSRVETFIASGNVIFETTQADPSALEARIEDHLRQSLGYAVNTFVRSNAQLARIAAYQPFPPEVMEAGSGRLYIAFLASLPPAAARQKLLDAQTPTDVFHFHDSELYWWCRTGLSESVFSGTLLEKIIGMPATVRNSTTVGKLVAKYPPDGQAG